MGVSDFIILFLMLAILAVLISGVVLMFASVFYFYVIFRTLLGKVRVPVSSEVPIPFSESLEHSEARAAGISSAGTKVAGAVKVLDRLWIFAALAALLVALMYGPLLIGLLLNSHPLPGLRLW